MLFNVNVLSILKTIGQILTAGVAITAFSLLLYALAFNLRDRVARSFVLILISVTIIYTAEAIGSTSTNTVIALWWLRVKWMGIVFLPATYFAFSESLRTLTGRTYNGKRNHLVWIVFLISLGLAALIPTNVLVGSLKTLPQHSPYLERTLVTNIFAAYYALLMIIAGINLGKSYQKAVTKTGRRRLIYLFAGASAPAIATFPFLFHGTNLFTTSPIFFWILLSLGCILAATFLVIMAYSVAFFGVTWTDRVVKSRLFKWLMRGPMTASLTLGVTTIVRRIGELFGDVYTGFVPLFMVGMILLFEYMITIFAPFWEKWLFYGADREDLSLIRSLEDHLLTRSDLDQFLESVCASICDRLQVNNAFIALFEDDRLDYLISSDSHAMFPSVKINEEVFHDIENESKTLQAEIIQWGNYKLIPLMSNNGQGDSFLMGIVGFPWVDGIEIEKEHMSAIKVLSEKSALALKNRRLQLKVLRSLEEMQPQMNYIQQLRAVSRFDQDGMLLAEDKMPTEDFVNWVKDALLHYWGGPKLTKSPLLNLRIVQQVIDEDEGNYPNALREVLKTGIERIKPEGERRFTGEWILYNIMTLKFLEGKKVREVASRLAMSEADLYRKQKIAIESVAKEIIEMEKLTAENKTE